MGSQKLWGRGRFCQFQYFLSPPPPPLPLFLSLSLLFSLSLSVPFCVTYCSTRSTRASRDDCRRDYTMNWWEGLKRVRGGGVGGGRGQGGEALSRACRALTALPYGILNGIARFCRGSPICMIDCAPSILAFQLHERGRTNGHTTHTHMVGLS